MLIVKSNNKKFIYTFEPNKDMVVLISRNDTRKMARRVFEKELDKGIYKLC